jgi:uncharacterized protein (TIGR02118 family)
MIRRVSFIRRAEGLTREQFHAHWTGEHAGLVRRVPGIRGLRFTMVDHRVPADIGWDGVGETWFDTVADADAAFATEPHASLLRADRPKFIGHSHTCYVEEGDPLPPSAIASLKEPAT